MFERFTKPARAAVVEAQVQARRLGHHEITPDHVLLGLLVDSSAVPARVLADLGLDHERLSSEVEALGTRDADALRSIGVDLDEVRAQAEAAFGPGALDARVPRRRGLLRGRTAPGTSGHLPFTRPAKKALEHSLRQAIALKHDWIGVEHLLLGLLADDSTMASRTLDRLGVSPAEVRTLTTQALAAAPRR